MAQSDAEKAYAAATALIEKAIAEGTTEISFYNQDEFKALDRLSENIVNLTSLTTIDIDGTQISDISILTQCPNLTNLDIGTAPVGDLSVLISLPKLTTVRIDRADLSEFAQSVAKSAQITSVTLWGTQGTDIAPLSGLAQLQSLSLWDTQVADITPLSGLAQLQSLDLRGTRVADIAPLSGLAQLHSLNLWKTQVTDIAPLSGLAQLQNLNLWKTQVTDIAPLSGLAQLQSLNLKDTQVADLSPIKDLPKMTGRGSTLSSFGWNYDNGLFFTNTPATEADPQLKALSKIYDNEERAQKTLAYLRGEFQPSEDVTSEEPPPLPKDQDKNDAARPSTREVRAALEASYPVIRDRAAYLVHVIQTEMAAHGALPIPNDPEQLDAYEAKRDTLTKMLAAATSVASAIPETVDAPVSDEDVTTLRDRLVNLASMVNKCVAYLDAHPGSYGALWKVGLITSVGSLLGSLGIAGLTVPVGLGIAGGALGAQTFKVIIEQRNYKK
ncbi:MAG: leucine-rich repeat domain-containing protein [Pseudomonadota bacterium]